jgi:hypothetical protein
MQIGWLDKLAVFGFPATDKDCATPGSMPSLDIREAVSYHVRFRQTNAEVVGGLNEQPDARFPTGTMFA